jgi:hypothetical protein
VRIVGGKERVFGRGHLAMMVFAARSTLLYSMARPTQRSRLWTARDRHEGYKLAITMLRQLEASPELCDACALEELRTGKTTPHDNIVYRYLVKCRARSLDAQAMHGAAVAVF